MAGVSTDDGFQNLNQKLIAGLGDAGMSSLATFVVGVVAIRTLTAADLGTYSVLFAAFLTGSLVPAETHFLPRQVTAMKSAKDLRLNGIGRAILASVAPGAVGAAVVGLAALAIRSHSDPSFLVPEMLAAMGLVVVSPAQDHLRRCFHYGERSWGAALISFGQLLAVIGISAVSAVKSLPLARLPLTILLAANGFSLLVGLVLARDRALKQQIPVDRSVKSRQILISSLAIVGAGLASTIIMSLLVGPDLVGYAEAARTVAQPVLVVTFGLTAALGSRAVSAVHERNHARAKDANRLFIIFLSLTTLFFFTLFLLPQSLDLIGALLPLAVAIPALALVSIAGNFLSGLSYFWREQIINGGKEQAMAEVDVWSVSVPVAAALASPWFGAFARGIGSMGQNIYRTLYYRRLRRQIYAGEAIGSSSSTNLPR